MPVWRQDISADERLSRRVTNAGFTYGAALTLAAQCLLLAAALLFSDEAGTPQGLAGWLTFWAHALSTSLCTLLTLWMVVRAPAGAARRFWGVIGLILGLTLSGEIIENRDYLEGINNVLDANDALFVAAKIGVVGLQFGALKRILALHSLRLLAFDIVAAFSAVTIVIWFLLMSSREASLASMTSAEQAAMIAYAILDVAIIFNFLTIAMRSDDLDESVDRVSRLAVFLGLFLLSAGDLRWEVDKLNARPILSDSASMVIAHFAYLCVSLGIARSGLAKVFAQQPRLRVAGMMQDIVPFAHILAAFGLIYLIGWDFFQPLGRGLFLALTFAVIMLLLRQSMAFRAQLDLKTKLAISTTEAQLANWFRYQGADPNGLGANSASTRAALQKTLDGPWISSDEKARLSSLLEGAGWPATVAFEVEQAKTAQLSAAIDQGWFEPWYQPIHRIADGRIVSMEMLARCQHPVHGLLTPDAFIDAIETTGLSGQLTRALLPLALRDLRILTDTGLIDPDVSLAINVTASEFEDVRFGPDLIGFAREYGIAPHRLTLELTERLVADGRVLDKPSGQMMRRRGVELAIDDFGTGYSSLAYLDRFQPDIVKISQSFIDDIDKRTGLVELVRSVIDMAARLKIRVVVEGVERQTQIDILKDLDCQFVQGYVFSHPMPLDKLQAHLKSMAAAAA